MENAVNFFSVGEEEGGIMSSASVSLTFLVKKAHFLHLHYANLSKDRRFI
jgi:hypothetical protein